MSSERPEVATLEPQAEPNVPVCRVCGCTDEQACEGGCSWVEDPQLLGDLCSSCLPLVRLVRDGIRAELGGAGSGVTINLNVVADLNELELAKIDHLFRGLASLMEGARHVP